MITVGKKTTKFSVMSIREKMKDKMREGVTTEIMEIMETIKGIMTAKSGHYRRDNFYFFFFHTDICEIVC